MQVKKSIVGGSKYFVYYKRGTVQSSGIIFMYLTLTFSLIYAAYIP